MVDRGIIGVIEDLILGTSPVDISTFDNYAAMSELEDRLAKTIDSMTEQWPTHAVDEIEQGAEALSKSPDTALRKRARSLLVKYRQMNNLVLKMKGIEDRITSD